MNKKLKHIIKIIIFTLLIININNVYSDVKCSIDETPEYIENYIKDIHKIVKNVNKVVSEKYEPPKVITGHKKSFLKMKVIKDIQGSINKLFSWEGYETDLEFIIQGNINEVPKQIYRDVKILQDESRSLKLAKPEGANIELTSIEICEGISNCNFNPNKKFKAIKVIELLKKSTIKIKNIIKNQSNDYAYKDENIKVYLINQDQLYIDYSKENLKNCNLSENGGGKKGFFLTIIEKIKNISVINKKGEEGMADWKEAIDLLWGSAEDAKYKKKEKELLAKELQKQGIGGDSASAIISNIDAYNDSENGEFPFLKGKQGFFNSLQLEINEFEEALEKKFPGYKTGKLEDKTIASKEIPDEIKKLKKIQNDNIDINSTYNKLKSLSIDENISDDQLINRIIDTHISISKMINSLNKTCPISVKVCNSQKRGQGDCGQCN